MERSARPGAPLVGCVPLCLWLLSLPGTGAEETGISSETESHGPHAANAVLFLMIALAFGIIFRRAAASFIIPFTGLLTIWGICVGLIDQQAHWEHLGEGIALWESMPPTLFLLTFLPILLFGSGSSLDWHTFFRNLTTIFTLAFPGVGIHMVIVAVVYKYAFPYDWSWTEAFLYGAIISATDPVAVVAIMKEVGASKRLGHIIEGESLLNDGSAYVFFLIFFDMYSGVERSAGSIVAYFFELIFVAAAFGVLFGILLTIFLILVYRDFVVEITATVTAAFLCFWCAEELAGVSGVLAVVCLSIFMAGIGKYSVSPEVSHSMEVFWAVLEFMANSVVFFYFGVLIAIRIWEGHQGANEPGPQLLQGSDWGWAFLNWVLLNVIRLVTVALLQPFMHRFGDGFSWQDVVLATWAGLRGAVGLSLALIVDLAARQPNSTIDPKFATITVFFAGTMSVLTIIVQGSTMPWLLSALGLTRKTPVQLQHLLVAAREVEEYAERNLAHLKEDHLLGAPHWGEVIDATALDIEQLLPSKRRMRELLGKEGAAEAEGLLHEAANEAMTLSDIVTDQGHGLDKDGLGAPPGMAKAQEARKRRHDRRRQKRHESMASVKQVLEIFQERRINTITAEAMLEDLRTRYLHAASAVFAEGFEKGYISGEQHAALNAVAARARANVHEPISGHQALRRLVHTPLYIRVVIKALNVAGAVLPICKRWATLVLYLNMESDITMVAAYVFAHNEAMKGMAQLLSIVEDSAGHPDAQAERAESEQDVIQQVITEGRRSRDEAAALLAGFRRDYPEIMRTVKTRETAQTVLMHKTRFVRSLGQAGLLESKEANTLLDLIYQRLKQLYFHIPTGVHLPSVADIVSGHMLFAHLSPADTRKVLEAGRSHVYDPGAHLFSAGDAPKDVFIILQGTVSRQWRDDDVLRINGAGAAIGITEVLLDCPRHSQITAETTVHVFVLPTHSFRAMLRHNSTLRLKAFQAAAASVALHMSWPFAQGLSYGELVAAFNSCELLDPTPRGASLQLDEAAILMVGSVTAMLPQRPQLARPGNMSKLQRNSVVCPPPLASHAAWGSLSPDQSPGGEVKVIEAPALLQPGTYPAETRCEVLTLPEKGPQHSVAKHHDHVRSLTLFNNQDGGASYADTLLRRPVNGPQDIATRSVPNAPGGGDSPGADGLERVPSLSRRNSARLSRGSTPLSMFVGTGGSGSVQRQTSGVGRAGGVSGLAQRSVPLPPGAGARDAAGNGLAQPSTGQPDTLGGALDPVPENVAESARTPHVEGWHNVDPDKTSE